MTNAEIIQAIRNEIERLIEESYFDESANLYSLLSFLSTLESEKPVPKDLEEAANNYLDGVYGKMPHSDYHIAIFIAGAKWQKEQMMKNAKDGWIDEECVIVLNNDTRIDLQPDYEKKPAFEFEYAQDVRVIVLPKED